MNIATHQKKILSPTRKFSVISDIISLPQHVPANKFEIINTENIKISLKQKLLKFQENI